MTISEMSILQLDTNSFIKAIYVHLSTPFNNFSLIQKSIW